MPFANVMSQNAQEHILIVGAGRHLLAEVNVAVLGAEVFRPTKEDKLTKLVQNTVCLFEFLRINLSTLMR